MLQSRKFLVAFATIAIALMVSETASAQLFKGRLRGMFGRRNAACCPAPAVNNCCSAATAGFSTVPVTDAASVMETVPAMEMGSVYEGGAVESSFTDSGIIEGGSYFGENSVIEGGSIIESNGTDVVEGAFIEGSAIDTGIVEGGTVIQDGTVIENSVMETTEPSIIVQDSPSDVVEAPVESTLTVNKEDAIEAAKEAVATEETVLPPTVDDGN